MKYVCTSRPCNDRHGSKWKLFWVLESVDISCCQDCSGHVIPPNKVFSTSRVENECTVFKHSICQTNTGMGIWRLLLLKFEDYFSETKSGNIEVSYESTDCCSDTSGWISSNLSILEPSSCSVRVCKEGKPAQWDRKYVSKGLVRSIFSIWPVPFNINWELETNLTALTWQTFSVHVAAVSTTTCW